MKKIAGLLIMVLCTHVLYGQNHETDEQPEKSKYDITVATVGVLQALQQDDLVGALQPIPAGIQSAAGNLMVSAELWPELSVYFEFYFSGKHHEGIVTPREGYLYLDRLPEKLNYFGLNRLFKVMDIKAGHFETDFGNWHLIRSDNAEVQRNPLVGNYIIDANTVEPGVEMIFNFKPLYLVAGISNGTTTGVFEPKRGTALHGKLGLDIEEKLQFSASVYRVDHSGNPALGCEKCQISFPDIPGSDLEDPDEEISDGSFSSLLAGNRSGSRYAGVLGDGPDVGTLNIGRGQDVFAWHLDGKYRAGKLSVFGMGGAAYDSDINGSEAGQPEENWYYYGGEVQYDLTDDLYLAARYNEARSTQVAGQDVESVATGLQIGGGYWVWDNLLFKVEYVRQTYEDFLPLYNGIPALIFDPEFYGVLAEVSVEF